MLFELPDWTFIQRTCGLVPVYCLKTGDALFDNIGGFPLG